MDLVFILPGTAGAVPRRADFLCHVKWLYRHLLGLICYVSYVTSIGLQLITAIGRVDYSIFFCFEWLHSQVCI